MARRGRMEEKALGLGNNQCQGFSGGMRQIFAMDYVGIVGPALGRRMV